MRDNHILSSYCHDIRTPLANAIGLLKMMEANQFQDTDKCFRYLSLAQLNLTQVKELIEELTNFISTCQNIDNKINIEEPINLINFNLIDWLKKKQAKMEPLFENHNRKLMLNIDLLPSLTIQSDIVKLERCLDNLLINALKYSYCNTATQLKAFLIDQYVGIQVINQGPTIPANEFERIFEPGYRSFKNEEAIDLGLNKGLGLTTVKNLTQLLGGQLKISSSSDSTRFTILLPYKNKF